MATTSFEHNGKTYELPDIASIKPGVLRKARKGADNVDKTFLLLELTLGEDSPVLEALDDLDPTKFNEVIEAWTSGAQLGESSGSSS